MPADRVLVVDDDEDILRMMVIALKRSGYQVDQAEDGYRALDTLEKNEPYAVLLTDLMMPGMSGIELLRAAREKDPNLEVITITAAGTLESAIAAMRAGGAYDYLLKPLESMEQLSIAVERAATHRRLLLEREALQKKIQDEAERLQALISNTGDAIFSANEQGVLTIVNPAAARLLGETGLVGQPALAHLPAALGSILLRWQATGTRLPVITEIPWADGTIQMVSLTPIYGNDGAWQGWVTSLRDVTHLKQLDELKTRMLTEAAKKIQLPLAQAINTLAELNLLAEDNPRLAEHVYRLTRVWGRIQEWMDDLLATTQIDSAPRVERAEVDLATFLRETQRYLPQDQIQAQEIKFTLNIARQLPWVQADPNRLGELLQELVKRAALRSMKGGEIRVLAREHLGQVWVDVVDEGPAVGEADLPHVFERSFASLKTAPLYSGVELAKAKAIMDQMGGQILVSGKGQQGRIITLCLPVIDKPDQP